MSVRRRHVPLRTCLTCGVKASKRDLLRIVATTDGPVELDLSGKKKGRGAYLCFEPKCTERKIQRIRLENALRTKITDDAWLALAESMRCLVLAK